jgi:ABC-type enterochelin transport system permease subunit
MELLKKEVAVIAAVEIAFGLIEGIAIPNIVERKKGEKFKLPPPKTIVKTAAALTVTGLISGMVADAVIKKMKLEPGPKRTTAIAVSAIAVNVVEAIVVPNFVNQKLDKNFKFQIPKAAVFFGSFMVLSVTAFAGGIISDSIISYMEKNDKNKNLA